jgi:hypothetical protein
MKPATKKRPAPKTPKNNKRHMKKNYRIRVGQVGGKKVLTYELLGMHGMGMRKTGIERRKLDDYHLNFRKFPVGTIMNLGSAKLLYGTIKGQKNRKKSKMKRK